MSFENAQQFVSRMKEDREFRRGVINTADTEELKEYLLKTGYDFNERELVEAMALCMDELERIVQKSS